MNKKIIVLVSFCFIFFTLDFILKDLNTEKVLKEGINIKEIFKEADGDFKKLYISNIPSGWVVFRSGNIKNGSSVIDSAKKYIWW